MCLDQKLQAKLIILDYKNQNGLVGLGFAYIITWKKKKHWLHPLVAKTQYAYFPTI